MMCTAAFIECLISGLIEAETLCDHVLLQEHGGNVSCVLKQSPESECVRVGSRFCVTASESKPFMNGGEVELEINALTVHRAREGARLGLQMFILHTSRCCVNTLPHILLIPGNLT